MKVDIDIGPHQLLKHCLYYDEDRKALYYKHRKIRSKWRIMAYYPISELPKEKREKFEQWLKGQST